MVERSSARTVDIPIIHTEKLGDLDGDPIIVMHGWGQSLEVMRALGELLSQYRTVYLMDLPGFGKSPEPSEDADTISYAKMLLDFMDSQNIERAHLLGHSFGGRVSIRFASRYRDRATSITLVDSGGLKRQLTGAKKLRSTYIKLLSRSTKLLDNVFGTKLFKDWFTPKYGSRDYRNSSGVMRKVMVRAVNEDVSEDAMKVDNPTFILWGEEDQETPVEMAHRLNNLISNSKVVVLPGKDHFPFLRDGAHLCAHHILGFLKSIDEAGGSDSRA